MVADHYLLELLHALRPLEKAIDRYDQIWPEHLMTDKDTVRLVIKYNEHKALREAIQRAKEAE